MSETLQAQQTPTDDRPLVDETPYGSGKDDSITDTTEKEAVTHKTITIEDQNIHYTARAGHLVIRDMISAVPTAKIFYVSFTKDGAAPTERPVTFFYNGGPGSSSVFLLLGSFAPRHIKTNMPHFTQPAPYSLEDNADCLLDHSDLVFINPVGTGYSTAIAPHKNGDFWGVDKDAGSIKQFVKRYLTKFNRWNSPKFLFGESYGTPRTCVLTWLLHEDGVDLNGIVLQSSVLDYSKFGNTIGLLPTLAADAFYHKKVTLSPRPLHLAEFAASVEKFARGPYAAAKATYPDIDERVLQTLSEMIGIPPDVLKTWQLDPGIGGGTAFLTSLLKEVALGAYDGRVTADDAGIAELIDPNSGGNDPTITAVGGVYTAMWNVYMNDELKYSSTAPFLDLNNEAFLNWDFSHTDPTGAQQGGQNSLYTAGDLAAAMALNPYLKVFCANGYFDAVTPFFQTVLNLQTMPLDDDDPARRNLTVRNYPSGHMIYLDNDSRQAMKRDLAEFYHSTRPELFAAEAAPRRSHGRRRMGRTPY